MSIRPFFRLLKGLLTFTRPVVVRFDYTHVIIANKPYLLFSWAYKRGYRLRIREIGFSSYLSGGSAYRQIRPGDNLFTVKISGGWRSVKLQVALKSFNAEGTDLRLKPAFRNLAYPVISFSRNIQYFRPKIARQLRAPHLLNSALKTANLNYPH